MYHSGATRGHMSPIAISQLLSAWRNSFLIMMSFATGLATPTITDVRTGILPHLIYKDADASVNTIDNVCHLASDRRRHRHNRLDVFKESNVTVTAVWSQRYLHHAVDWNRARHTHTTLVQTMNIPPPPSRPFYGPFSGTSRESRCQKRTCGLYGARED